MKYIITWVIITFSLPYVYDHYDGIMVARTKNDTLHKEFTDRTLAIAFYDSIQKEYGGPRIGASSGDSAISNVTFDSSKLSDTTHWYGEIGGGTIPIYIPKDRETIKDEGWYEEYHANNGYGNWLQSDSIRIIKGKTIWLRNPSHHLKSEHKRVKKY